MYLLLRNKLNPTHSRGTLFLNGEILCHTLCLPYVGNHTNISCIPDGIYDLAPHNTKKFPDTFRIENVPNRTAILFHTGNRLRDTHGCFLVGTEFRDCGADTMILNSKFAMNMLRRKLILPAEIEIINE